MRKVLYRYIDFKIKLSIVSYRIIGSIANSKVIRQTMNVEAIVIKAANNKAFRHVETLYQTQGKQTLLLVNKR